VKTHPPWLAPLLSVLILLVFLGVWHLATQQQEAEVKVDPEYAALVGAAAATGPGRVETREMF